MFDKFLLLLGEHYNQKAPNYWVDERSGKATHIRLFYPLGQVSIDTKNRLKRIVERLIEDDPSHVVTGTYTSTNIDSWPHILLLTIADREDSAPSVMLNFSNPQHVLVIGQKEPEDSVLVTLNETLSLLTPLFIFASGRVICESLATNQVTEMVVRNIVYTLGHPNLSRELGGDVEAKMCVGKSPQTSLEVDLLERLNMYYEYGQSIEELTNQLKTRPHVVAVVDGTIVAAARANAIGPKMAVVGGVYTKPNQRKKGLGYLVSQELTRYLLKLGKEVCLETDVNNFPAQRIYTQLGYQPVGGSMFLERGSTMIKDDIIGDRGY